MEDPYEHEDPMMGYAPCNVPGRGCDPAAFDDCFAEGCACEDDCARWGPTNMKPMIKKPILVICCLQIHA